MLLSKTVKIKWISFHKNYYLDKGYKFTKIKDEFEVKIEDLSNNSHAIVEVQCDNCNTILKPMTWQVYKKYVHNDGKYYCRKCSLNLYGNEKMRKTRLKNGKSFYQWCIENNRQDILDRWDYELNEYTPSEINYGTGKKYYFKCPNGIHESELKSLGRLISGQTINLNCDKCNLIASNYAYLEKYFVNKNDFLECTIGSIKRVSLKCPDCGHIKNNMNIPDLIKHGFSCPKCGDGISYPEKFVFSVLEQLKIDFTTQLSKNILQWCDKYKYDFYIPTLNTIIEAHGSQHYEISHGNWKSLESIQNNDKIKQIKAISNGIIYYITIDCRKSSPEYIKNSILNSELSNLYDMSKIDWNVCNIQALKSMVFKVCEAWNNGINDVSILSSKLKLSKVTIRRYLKKRNKYWIV